MRFVGVDLAWTTKGRTGLCAVEDGTVTASTTVSGDGELMQWLEPLSKDDVLIAIDAPVILRNETGRRPCDQLISICFGRYDASTHSANLQLPSFRNGVRGELLARALGIGIDPDFETRQPVRRAIEVYPHPAIVALFDLPKTLKYKNKRGRTVESRKLALVELLAHLESLRDREPSLDVTSAPRWSEIVRAVHEASAPIHLTRVEDEIDSYVCAYIALYYWTHGTTRCRIAGDVETGYIVTPVSVDQGRCIDSLAATAAAGASGEGAESARGFSVESVRSSMTTGSTTTTGMTSTASESTTSGEMRPVADAPVATSSVSTMSFQEALVALTSLVGEDVLIFISEQGADEGEPVASLYGMLELVSPYGVELRELALQDSSGRTLRVEAGIKASVFRLAGQVNLLCLRPDQFAGALWVDVPRDGDPSPGRELVLTLGAINVVVAPVGR